MPCKGLQSGEEALFGMQTTAGKNLLILWCSSAPGIKGQESPLLPLPPRGPRSGPHVVFCDCSLSGASPGISLAIKTRADPGGSQANFQLLLHGERRYWGAQGTARAEKQHLEEETTEKPGEGFEGRKSDSIVREQQQQRHRSAREQ